MSEILSAEEFIENTGTAEIKENFRMAVVVALFPNNTAKITFDGESDASEKQYSYIASYVPKIGDRVLLAAVSGTYIILGKVNYNVSPSAGNSDIVANTLKVTGGVDFDSSMVVDGLSTFNGSALFKSRIGFYNVGPVDRQSVTMPTTSATLAQLITSVRDLETKLNNVGIIRAT